MNDKEINNTIVEHRGKGLKWGEKKLWP